MKRTLPFVLAFSLAAHLVATTLVGCRENNSRTNSPDPVPVLAPEESPVPRIPEEDPDEPFSATPDVPYEPKTSFTGYKNLEPLLSPPFGNGNTRFLDGCYYTGDTSTPFLASFAERWNKATFLRRFVNAEELFVRNNTHVDDSLTTETVRGEFPMLKNEYQLAFRNSTCVAKAKKLVKMLRTIDHEPEACKEMSGLFLELVNIPYDTPDYATEAEIEAIQKDFWTLYDKSQFVPDIAEIQHVRVNEDDGTMALERLRISLQKRYVEATDFDERCILACEMASCGQENGIDYLGELIEAGRYSRYLLEVWVAWRLYAQESVFGISTFSIIPDNLYDNARLLVAKEYLKHIRAHPDDMLARVLLLNLTYTENLHRFGGYYGNESLLSSWLVKERYFLPEGVAKE